MRGRMGRIYELRGPRLEKRNLAGCYSLPTVFFPVRGGSNLGWMKAHPLTRASKGPGPGITCPHMMSHDTDSGLPMAHHQRGIPAPQTLWTPAAACRAGHGSGQRSGAT